MRRQYAVDDHWKSTVKAIRAEHPSVPIVKYTVASLPLSHIVRLCEGQSAFALGYKPGGLLLPRSAELELRVLEEKSRVLRVGSAHCSSVVVATLETLWAWDVGHLGYPSKDSFLQNIELLAHRPVAPEEIVSIARYDTVTIR